MLPRLTILISVLVILIGIIGGALYFAPYLKTSLTDAPLPQSPTTDIEEEESQVESSGGSTKTAATIITGTVLVQAPSELAAQLREILTDLEESPPVSSPEVLGAHTINEVFNLTPILESVGASDIIPVIPLPPHATAAELSAIDRWFEVKVPVPEFAVQVTDQQTLELPLFPANGIDQQLAPKELPFPANGIDQQPTFEPNTPDSPSPEAQNAVAQMKNIIASLQNSGQFETVEPIWQVTTTAIPNDSFFNTNSVGVVHDDMWGLKRIQAPAAWDVTTGSPDTIVAVVDTGIDLGHRDLQGNFYQNAGETGPDTQGNDKKSNGVDDDQNGYVDDWQGWNFYDNNNNPTDNNRHGTHVAGTIAAVGNNYTDVVGIMWQAKLLPVKFLSANGSGTSTGGAAALRYAADRSAHVINNSWGGPPSKIVEDAVNYAHAKGSLVVAAAGNSACDIASCGASPANVPNALAVSALTPADTRAPFSNFGEKIELTAPGGGESSDKKGDKIISLTPSNTTEWLAGTSMAAPHVTGAAGLLFAQHPEWTHEQVRQRLRETASDIGPPGKDADFGFGVLNAAAAVGGKSVDISLSSPPPYAALGATATLEGTAAGSNFRSYAVESSWDITAVSWKPVQQGTLPVVKGSLGTFSRPVDFEGPRLFRLSVNPDQPDRIQIVRHTYMSSSLRPGWPVSLSNLGLRINELDKVTSSPALGDLDGDGDHEIVLALRENGVGSVVLALDATGQMLWKKTLEPALNNHSLITLEIADINNDNKQEVIINNSHVGTQYSNNSINVLDGTTGQNLPGWPQNIKSSDELWFIGTPAVADVDGDNIPEIIASAWHPYWNLYPQQYYNHKLSERGAIYVWRTDGQLLPGWPAPFTFSDFGAHENESAVVAKDTNGDGKAEIFLMVSRFDARWAPKATSLFKFTPEGNIASGWPVEVAEPTANGDISYNGFSLGNVSGGPSADLVVLTQTGRLTALNSDSGATLPGWPIDLRSANNEVQGPFGGAPLLVDLNGDDGQEIVVGQHRAFYKDGKTIPGWDGPQAGEAYGHLAFPPIAANVNNDGPAEIVSTDLMSELQSYVGAPELYAYGTNGSTLSSWHKTISGRTFQSAPVVGDLDGDKKLELVAVSTVGSDASIIVWNLPTTTSNLPHDFWPTLHGNPAHTHAFQSSPTAAQSWQNPSNRFDVNNDGSVSPQDLLLLVNDKNQKGFRDLIKVSEPPPPPFIDVNGDRLFNNFDIQALSACIDRQGIGSAC